MRRHAILFDWPIAEINRLADSQIASDFSETLDENSQETFATLTDSMRNIGADLAQAKARRIQYSSWRQLESCLDQFSANFSNFPGANINNLRFHALLAEKLSYICETPEIKEDNIDENLFEIRPLQKPIPQCWFVHQNRTFPSSSIVVFSCGEVLPLASQIEQSNISPDFIYQLLAAISVAADISTQHWVLVTKSNPRIEDPAVEAFVRLLILSTGEYLHTPKKYAAKPNILDVDQLKIEAKHQQWHDIHNVISEYNSRDEILLKYLTIYHVIENMMLKFPIVELERQKAGKIFSIRDFRRLYSQTEGKEQEMLKRLLSETFKLYAKPSVPFSNHLNTRWKSFVSRVQKQNVDQALGLLGISNKETDKITVDLFTRIVYQIRCAIVHNKETELHLTYASLDKNVTELIESFLLPSLEEICFYLVGCPNNQVWYSSKELVLYS